MTEREKQIKDLALRVALSPSFQAFFNSTGAPETWEKLVATWDENTTHAMALILDEEDSMRKDLGMETARKTKINQTALLQRIEQLRLAAYTSNQKK